jgi:hypothetical protein
VAAREIGAIPLIEPSALLAVLGQSFRLLLHYTI